MQNLKDVRESYSKKLAEENRGNRGHGNANNYYQRQNYGSNSSSSPGVMVEED
jgi:hypothetical protein